MQPMEQITKELLSLPPESRILLIETLAKSLRFPPENTLIEKAPVKKSMNSRSPLFGSDKGKVLIGDDFEAPLEEFSDYI
jgi:hypothetical protein